MGRHKLLENDKEIMADNLNNLATLPEDYTVRLQLARLKEAEQNAERLRLDNVKKNIDIEKTNCNLTYIDVAEAEINRAIGPLANLIKNMDQILTTRLNLSGKQTAIVQDVVDDILNQLSSIEINLKSTEEIDAERSHANLDEKTRKQAEVARTKARKG